MGYIIVWCLIRKPRNMCVFVYLISYSQPLKGWQERASAPCEQQAQFIA